MRAGQMTLRAMTMLKKAHTEHFGGWCPQVPTGTVAGPASSSPATT